MNKQITEDYCSFEVAKLLKEKGFYIPCRQAYFNGSLVDYTMYGFCDGELLDCPSQSLALKWLREVHNRYIEIYTDRAYNFKDIVFRPAIYDRELNCLWESDNFLTYEQAVEAALFYVLKNLI